MKSSDSPERKRIMLDNRIEKSFRNRNTFPPTEKGMAIGTISQQNVKPVPTSHPRAGQQNHGTLPHITNPIQQGIPQACHGAFQEQQPKTCQGRSELESLPEVLNTRSVFNKLDRTKLSEDVAQAMSPTEVLKAFKDRLTEFEREEIMAYPEIWYLGLNGKKIAKTGDPALKYGNDNKEGEFPKVMHGHISYRYEILDVIGSGTFGHVLKCLDHKTNEKVAVKVMHKEKSFDDQSDDELMILDLVRKKDSNNNYNVIHMKEYFFFRNHLCITFELLGPNLYELIKKNHFQGFSQAKVRLFASSLLKCLYMLQQEKIIHCDLKPENIVLSNEGESNVKVIDFGLSCFEDKTVHNYIQSRYYRSPEVVLGHPYSSAIDMWSLGCILAELDTGLPLFPGEDEVDQLACILEVLGMPPNDFLQFSSRRLKFFDSKGIPRNLFKRHPNTKDLPSMLQTDDPVFLDFIKRCLTWDPKKRMTPKEALQHPWLQDSRHKAQPKTCPVRQPVQNQSTADNATKHTHPKLYNHWPEDRLSSSSSDKPTGESSGSGKLARAKCLCPARSIVDKRGEGQTMRPPNSSHGKQRRGVKRSSDRRVVETYGAHQ